MSMCILRDDGLSTDPRVGVSQTSSPSYLNGVAKTCVGAPTRLLKPEVIGSSSFRGTRGFTQLVTLEPCGISRGYK